MKEGINNPKLILEEKKALNLFLWLFYITYIAYELLYYYIFPRFSTGEIIGNPEGIRSSSLCRYFWFNTRNFTILQKWKSVYC